MPRRRMSIATGIVVVVVAACAATVPPYNPFKIPRTDIEGRIRTVVIVPFVTIQIDSPDAVTTSFEALIATKLRNAGYTVVPSAAYEAVWERAKQQIGGYFDPVTGRRDEAKFKAVRTHALREIADTEKVDATVGCIIRPVTAAFAAGTAYWHGVSEPIATGGFWSRVGTGDSHGTAPALSLVIVMEGIDGQELFVNAGGIQLLQTVEYGKFVDVPKAQLLSDAARNATAVDIALAPLVGPPGGTPTPVYDGRGRTPTPRNGMP